MKRRIKRKGSMRGSGLVVLLSGLLLGAALLPLLSAAQTAADNAPAINAPRDEVRDAYGFTWARGNVSTAEWSARKSVDVNFTVRRSDDNNIFRELHTEDITAHLDGQPVTLEPGSLNKRPESAPTSTLFMIDCSESMVSAASGVDKLRAAKESLRNFVSQLGPNDRAAIYSFAGTRHTKTTLTNDQKELRTSIDALGVCDDGKFTNLYAAIETALSEAERNSVIVLLSDGMEDNDAVRAEQDKDIFNRWETNYLRNHKDGWEKKLSDRALNAGVRIFSVALGQPLDEYGRKLELGTAESLKYVDLESLENISNRTNGGFARHIDPATLSNDPALRQQSLNERLKDVLIEIKKASRFAYAQPMMLSGLREGGGELQLDIAVPKGDERVVRQLVWTYTWDKRSPPVFNPGRVLESFIETRPSLSPGSLTRIYLTLLSPLALLGLIPPFVRRVGAAWELRRIRHAIKVVALDSPLRGKLCPNEQGPGSRRYLFGEGDLVLVCPKCNTPHHMACWEYNRHQCMSHGCEYSFVVPPELMGK